MSFEDLPLPPLEDFERYSYHDDYPERNTEHWGMRHKVPNAAGAYFLIEYVEPFHADEQAAFVWYFQDETGRSIEDNSGGYDTLQQAYDAMKDQLDLAAERKHVYSAAIDLPRGQSIHCSFKTMGQLTAYVQEQVADVPAKDLAGARSHFYHNGKPLEMTLSDVAGASRSNERESDSLNEAIKAVKDKRENEPNKETQPAPTRSNDIER